MTREQGEEVLWCGRKAFYDTADSDDANDGRFSAEEVTVDEETVEEEVDLFSVDGHRFPKPSALTRDKIEAMSVSTPAASETTVAAGSSTPHPSRYQRPTSPAVSVPRRRARNAAVSIASSATEAELDEEDEMDLLNVGRDDAISLSPRALRADLANPSPPPDIPLPRPPLSIGQSTPSTLSSARPNVPKSGWSLYPPKPKTQ